MAAQLRPATVPVPSEEDSPEIESVIRYADIAVEVARRATKRLDEALDAVQAADDHAAA